MAAILNNLGALKADTTADYFNNFFKPEFSVSQNVDDTIVGFFEKVASNKEAARTLAGAVIYTAKTQNLDPMHILQQFMEMPAGQLSSYLTMFLNLNRIGTSLLGVSNIPVTNKYVSRMILA